MDDNSHGTHCAGIAAANGVIKGVAPDARLLAVKVCSTGGCMDSDAMSGIDWAVANGANIISISLGTNRQPSAGNEPLQMLCDAASRMGVTIVAAVGNEGPGTGTIADIAASRTVIAVGADNDRGTASAADDVIPVFGCRGPAAYGRFKPDVIAPSVGIYSTGLGGSYLTKQGTSMAAPHVAGAAALLLEYNRSLTPGEIKSYLMNYAENVSGHPFETGAGLINVTRSITSRIHASINGGSVWEESIAPGTNATAALMIKNMHDHPVNASISASALSDNNGETIDPSSLVFPEQVSLEPMEEKTLQITFKSETDASQGTYAAILRIASPEENIRIPLSITVPLLGEGTIQGAVDDDCSLKTQEGCGMNPAGNIAQWGDWRFYKLENNNGSILRVNLTWEGTDTDLDLYLFGPDGGLYGLSGDANTESEYISLANPVYPEYWAAVYAYDIAPTRIGYDLHVSYASTIQLEPAIWQGAVARGEQLVLNYTLINDGSSDTTLEIEAVTQKNIANKAVTGTIANTGEGNYNFVWKKSTSGLTLEGTQYMNATLTWNNPAKDLDMYFLNNTGNDWNVSKYISTRKSDILGIGKEEILNADIKYYLEAFSDIGVGVSNPGSSQGYALALNFSGEGLCDYATTNPTTISSLAPEEQRAIHVSVNTSNLSAGSAYDFVIVIKKNGADKARSQVRITVTEPEQATSTTTSTTVTSTTIQVTTTTTTSTSSQATTTVINSTTTTTEASCSLAGDYPPCGEVMLSEVVAFINKWVENEAGLNDVIALINAWAQPQ
jgi:hypothetical protein